RNYHGTSRSCSPGSGHVGPVRLRGREPLRGTGTKGRRRSAGRVYRRPPRLGGNGGGAAAARGTAPAAADAPVGGPGAAQGRRRPRADRSQPSGFEVGDGGADGGLRPRPLGADRYGQGPAGRRAGGYFPSRPARRRTGAAAAAVGP